MKKVIATVKPTTTYHIILNTLPLISHPAGPFSLAFQLTDGSNIGDGNNTITLSNFQFGGGSASGTPAKLGVGGGDLSSKITLTDESTLNYTIQPFVPGKQLQFDLTTTNAVDAGTPDEFTFSIFDKSGKEIPTQTGISYYDEFIILKLNGPTPSIQVFATNTSRSPVQGPPINISTPTIQPVP